MAAQPKEYSRLDPEVVIPKIKNLKEKVVEFVVRKKKLTIILVLIILLVLFVGYRRSIKSSKTAGSAKSVTVQVDKNFSFAALNNQGKPTGAKIKFKLAEAEKTEQVLVKEQTYTAKNNKMFLIVNLELKNDETTLQNLIPGDLVRLTIEGDDENKFAPDLHNSLVAISALSTKLDRVGFVISADAKKFKLFVGELEGKKEEVKVEFPS